MIASKETAFPVLAYEHPVCPIRPFPALRATGPIKTSFPEVVGLIQYAWQWRCTGGEYQLGGLYWLIGEDISGRLASTKRGPVQRYLSFEAGGERTVSGHEELNVGSGTVSTSEAAIESDSRPVGFRSPCCPPSHTVQLSYSRPA